MNVGLISLALFGSLVFLLALGLPLVFAMGGMAAIGIYLVVGPQAIPIVYFNVIAPLKDKEVLNEEKYRHLMDEHAGKFTAMMGAEAIKQLLKQLDIEELSIELRHKMKTETSQQKKLNMFHLLYQLPLYLLLLG